MHTSHHLYVSQTSQRVGGLRNNPTRKNGRCPIYIKQLKEFAALFLQISIFRMVSAEIGLIWLHAYVRAASSPEAFLVIFIDFPNDLKEKKMFCFLYKTFLHYGNATYAENSVEGDIGPPLALDT